MHRVLSVVEILENIFTFADKRSNANNACVCKKWSEICLRHLWRDVDDLYRLFRVLSPLRMHMPVDLGKYAFKTDPKLKDWKRFEIYGQFVRRIKITNKETLQFRLVLDVVARNRPKLTLFPNLHTLEWFDSAEGLSLTQYSLMFMHKNVKHFVVTLPGILHLSMNHLSSYFDDVTGRMPMLTCLELRGCHTEDSRVLSWVDEMDGLELEPAVLALIHGLSNLRVIVLPQCSPPSKVIEGLSRLPNLETILRREPKNGYSVYGSFKGFQLEEGAFPLLNHLALCELFLDAAKILKMPFFPSNLTILQIESPYFDGSSDLHELSVAISENCRLLTSIRLLCRRPAQAQERQEITLDPLRPLLSCSNITIFEIVYPYPFLGRSEDVEEIASKWPSLEIFTLNNDPVTFLTNGLLPTHESLPTLRCLIPFVQHCPRLQHLGVFLRATAMDIPTAHDVRPFQRLKCLDMGASFLDEVGPVTQFLSQICPVGCKVVSNITSSGKIGKLLRKKWKTVEICLPLLTVSRMEEKGKSMNRVRELEAEVAALRSELSRPSNSSIAVR